jgi:16S rRNA (guanine527-N7)-methyltransferase
MSSESDGASGARSCPELVAVLEESRALGFLGPGPVDAHVQHALAMGAAAGAWTGYALDLGAGGGVPGLVLACVDADARWVLLDAHQRRTEFLDAAVERLGLGARVTVVRTRAEETGRRPDQRGAYGLITARGFGPPAATAECAAPLLRPGGVLVVSDPPARGFDRWPPEPLAEIGLQAESLEVDGLRFTRLVKTSATPADLPRRIGLPTKRPLF